MGRKTKFGFIILISIAVLFLFATACNFAKEPERSSEPLVTTGEAKPQVTIKVYLGTDFSSKEFYKKVNEAFTARTGIQVESEMVPGAGNDMYKKVDLDLAAGGTVDVIPLIQPLILDKYVKKNYLLPLNGLMKTEHYDADQRFGPYLTKYDGIIYALPEQVSTWAVFYNKKIFDDAGVPYPPSEWTWEQYIETAKKLTDPAKGIYGSYMLDYDIYLFMLAKQHNVSAYKADGTSNYDDPLFMESLKFFGDLGNVYKIQPSWKEFKTQKLTWDGFMSGKYGMHLIGTWYTSILTNDADFPKDWEWGITQIPTDGKGTNNFGVTYTYAVNKNSAHPKEALEYVKFRAENAALMSGNIPALTDRAVQRKALKEIAVASGGSVTVNDLSKAFFDNNLGFIQEKNIGSAATEYSNIILSEGDLYLRGQRSLDDTVRAIKEKADAAIRKELSVQDD
ncbi:extracellular solute-binding protein [Cohnella sp. CFH 77786]|uniref:ABC transporter substrate-binding protein n=1 Tax=Cohnella sp. CFH 77786 TaxID=2662265 RepID=UPI001C6084ED|nr:extracellular solute-binding protein [Cohnella sp. CFH 77786]MBW5449296.1 extracellular solute-binding protein [Cohnella sp. CFH 77786]